MWCMKCVLSLDEVNEAPTCVCLQWVTAGFAEKRHDVGEKVEDEDAVVAGK